MGEIKQNNTEVSQASDRLAFLESYLRDVGPVEIAEQIQ